MQILITNLKVKKQQLSARSKRKSCNLAPLVVLVGWLFIFDFPKSWQFQGDFYANHFLMALRTFSFNYHQACFFTSDSAIKYYVYEYPLWKVEINRKKALFRFPCLNVYLCLLWLLQQEGGRSHSQRYAWTRTLYRVGGVQVTWVLPHRFSEGFWTQISKSFECKLLILMVNLFSKVDSVAVITQGFSSYVMIIRIIFLTRFGTTQLMIKVVAGILSSALCLKYELIVSSEI